MNDTINIHQIYQHEKQRWLREEAPRRSFRDLLSDSVPHWIIIVAAVLYSLSAPHTASVFDKLTPGWGWIAPVGVEFGLLYACGGQLGSAPSSVQLISDKRLHSLQNGSNLQICKYTANVSR